MNNYCLLILLCIQLTLSITSPNLLTTSTIISTGSGLALHVPYEPHVVVYTKHSTIDNIHLYTTILPHWRMTINWTICSLTAVPIEKTPATSVKKLTEDDIQEDALQPSKKLMLQNAVHQRRIGCIIKKLKISTELSVKNSNMSKITKKNNRNFYLNFYLFVIVLL